MRAKDLDVQFWLNAEFSLWEQINDARIHREPIEDLDVYCYKIPVAAYFVMTNSLRELNESLKGYF